MGRTWPWRMSGVTPPGPAEHPGDGSGRRLEETCWYSEQHNSSVSVWSRGQRNQTQLAEVLTLPQVKGTLSSSPVHPEVGI